MKKETLARSLVVLFILAAVAIPLAGRWLAGRNQPAGIELHARMPENGGWSIDTIQMEVGQPLQLHYLWQFSFEWWWGIYGGPEQLHFTEQLRLDKRRWCSLRAPDQLHVEQQLRALWWRCLRDHSQQLLRLEQFCFMVGRGNICEHST